MAVPTYTKAGAKATATAKLDKNVFEVEVTSHDLLKQAYQTYLTNGRDVLAVTKTRGLVRGGGRKPWKQKGTGRARFGSSRNPIWRGGGIVFGPTGEENYTKKINVKAKRTAVRQALSLAAKAGELVVVEDFTPKDGKSKAAATFLSKIGAKRNILIITHDKSEEVLRATNNLPNVIVCSAKYTNVYDLLNADSVVVTKKAVEILHDWLNPTATKEAK